MIKYTPVSGHLRLYDEGDYEHRDPYDFIVTVQWISATCVYLSGAKGTFTKKRWEEIAKELRKLGVKTYCMERAGKVALKKVPKGE